MHSAVSHPLMTMISGSVFGISSPTVQLTAGPSPSPSEGIRQEEVVWRVRGEPLNDQFTTTKRQWLASTLAELMKGAEIFVDSHL